MGVGTLLKVVSSLRVSAENVSLPAADEENESKSSLHDESTTASTVNNEKSTRHGVRFIFVKLFSFII